jgi:hypothetical protein
MNEYEYHITHVTHPRNASNISIVNARIKEKMQIKHTIIPNS